MEMKKILWPTDFSNAAEKALPQVKSLTEKYDAEIHVLYVMEDIAHHEPWYGVLNEEHAKEVSRKTHDAAARHLEQICDKYLDGCPLYIKHVASGDPAREILKLIDQEGIDMVIMASRGKKAHFPFGSVTEKVVKNSPVPVVTVPAKPEIEAAEA
jgi:nucleotide-binding universal stress UspA family protein